MTVGHAGGTDLRQHAQDVAIVLSRSAGAGAALQKDAIPEPRVDPHVHAFPDLGLAAEVLGERREVVDLTFFGRDQVGEARHRVPTAIRQSRVRRSGHAERRVVRCRDQAVVLDVEVAVPTCGSSRRPMRREERSRAGRPWRTPSCRSACSSRREGRGRRPWSRMAGRTGGRLRCRRHRHPSRSDSVLEGRTDRSPPLCCRSNPSMSALRWSPAAQSGSGHRSARRWFRGPAGTCSSSPSVPSCRCRTGRTRTALFGVTSL